MIESWLSSLAELLDPAKSSILIIYPVVFVAGVLTSLTPCVYPVIPIMVGFVGSQSEGKRWRSFLISIAYVLGMAVVYSALGMVAALSTKMMFGQIQTNPWVQIVVGNIIIFSALVLLGAVKLPIPGFLSGGGPASQRAGIAGAFVVGMASGFVTAPCTTPVLLVLLTFVAEKQSVLLGLTLLPVYSLGMGVLLVVLGTFVGLLKSLPKPGKWMVSVEKGFGFALILLGEYFLIKGGNMMVVTLW